MVEIPPSVSPLQEPGELWHQLRPRRRHLVVAFIGGHKTGKSTWINHIAGLEVAATDILPCTDEVGSYLFRVPPDERCWSCESGPVPFVREKSPDTKRLGTIVEIVDTPGIGSIEAEHGWDKSLLDLCHIVVMVHTAIQGIRADERDLLADLLHQGPSRIHVVFTRTDGVRDPARALEELTTTLRKGIKAYPKIAGITCSGRPHESETLIIEGTPLIERLREAATDGLQEHLTRLDVFHLERVTEQWTEAFGLQRKDKADVVEKLSDHVARIERSIAAVRDRLESIPQLLLSVARRASTTEIERAIQGIRLERTEQDPSVSPPLNSDNDIPAGDEDRVDTLLDMAGKALIEGGRRLLERTMAPAPGQPIPFEDVWSRCSPKAIQDAVTTRLEPSLQRHEADIASRFGGVAKERIVLDVNGIIDQATTRWLDTLQELGPGTNLDLDTPREGLVTLLDRVERNTARHVNTALVVEPVLIPLADSLDTFESQRVEAAGELQVFDTAVVGFMAKAAQLREAVSHASKRVPVDGH